MNRPSISFGLLVVLAVAISQPALAGWGDVLNTLSKSLPLDGNIQTAETDEQPAEITPSPVESLASEDIRKSEKVGTVTGAAVGAVVGYKVAGNNTNDKNMQKVATVGGAILGGMVGKQIGNKVGQVAANRRKQYASEQEFLESEIAASEKALSIREQDIKSTNEKIASMQKRIDQLSAKSELTTKEREESEALRTSVSQTIEENKALLNEYEDKIAYLEYSLETSELSANATATEKQQWEDKYAKLQSKTKQLVAQRGTLQEQTIQLAKSKEALDNALS